MLPSLKGTAMHRAVLVAVALSCFVGEWASAYYFDGNELFRWCESWHRQMSFNQDRQTSFNQDWFDGGHCGGYIGGVVDAFDTARVFCVPQGETDVKSGQLVEVVKLYLRDHPEMRHLPAADLVTAAIKEKFPCN